MPTKKKKTKQSAEEETRDLSYDDSEDAKPKLKNRGKQVSKSEGAGRLEKRDKDSYEEGYDSDTSELDVRINRKKRKEKEKAKRKKRNPREGSEDELSNDLQGTDKEDNNNDGKSKKRGDKIPDVIESTRKGKSLGGDKMGSKDKKSKGEDKKSKKDSEKEEEQVAGDEEEGKKKKKDKKKKGSVKGDSDEDTRKTKGKKKKVENYVEIYENELRNYEPEKVEDYEDEYHKKKGNRSLTIVE